MGSSSSTWHVVASSELKAFDDAMRDIANEATREGWEGRFSSKGHLIMRAPDGETTMSVSRGALRGRSDKNVRATLDRWKREQPGASFGLSADQRMPMLEYGDHAYLQSTVQNDERVRAYISSLLGPDGEVEISRRLAFSVNQVDPQNLWVVFDRSTMNVVSWGSGIADEGAAYVEVFGQDEPEQTEPEKEQPQMTMYRCEECGETFSQSRLLGQHKKRHVEYKNCPVCGVPIKYMQTHLRRQHPNVDVKKSRPQVRTQTVDKVRLDKAIEDIRLLVQSAVQNEDHADLIEENARLREENETLKARFEIMKEAMSA